MSDVREACRGKWRDILGSLGVDSRFLSGRHSPCPMCGGKDRFRFDDKDGFGSFYCSQCGPGDGITFAMRLKGWDFKEAASELERLAGKAKATPPKAKANGEYMEQLKIRLWDTAKPVVYGDVVSRYLDRRAIVLDHYPDALRFAESCLYRVPGHPDEHHPAMIAKVLGAGDGTWALHRTYLTADGAKLPVDDPRKLLSAMPKGGSVRLARPASVMGVAEGIETALAASILWNMPVWAAINAENLMVWRAPAIAEEIHIFADNDASFTGHAASGLLAKRLVHEGRKAHLQMPEGVNTDWNDVLIAERQPARNVA